MDKTTCMQVFDKATCMQIAYKTITRHIFVSFILEVLVKYFIDWLCTCINQFIKYTMEFGSAFFLKAALLVLSRSMSLEHF